MCSKVSNAKNNASERIIFPFDTLKLHIGGSPSENSEELLREKVIIFRMVFTFRNCDF